MSSQPQAPVLATLGGPATFSGQATRAVTEWMPQLGSVRYFNTIDEIWTAVSSGVVDSAVLHGETTHSGLDAMARRLIASKADLHVTGELLARYRCMLLGKPGASLDRIRLVLGHNSLEQCRDFLADRLAQAEVRIHEQNSVAAAAEVLASSGEIAVVGTLRSAETTGLAVLAPDIDNGSVGAWWILSRELQLSPRPDVLVIQVSSAVEGGLSDLLGRMQSIEGVTLRGIAAVSSGSIFRYDYLAAFWSRSSSLSPLDTVAGLPGCRLVGAFESVSADADGLVSAPPSGGIRTERGD